MSIEDRFNKRKNEMVMEIVKKYCIEYDKENGQHSESCYEGLSLYEYINNKLLDKKIDMSCDEWEKEYLKCIS